MERLIDFQAERGRGEERRCRSSNEDYKIRDTLIDEKIAIVLISC